MDRDISCGSPCRSLAVIYSVFKFDFVSESAEDVLDLLAGYDLTKSSVEEFLCDIDRSLLRLNRIYIRECRDAAFRIDLLEEPESKIKTEVDPLDRKSVV